MDISLPAYLSNLFQLVWKTYCKYWLAKSEKREVSFIKAVITSQVILEEEKKEEN